MQTGLSREDILQRRQSTCPKLSTRPRPTALRLCSQQRRANPRCSIRYPSTHPPTNLVKHRQIHRRPVRLSQMRHVSQFGGQSRSGRSNKSWYDSKAH
jgi:hypothetical protein